MKSNLASVSRNGGRLTSIAASRPRTEVHGETVRRMLELLYPGPDPFFEIRALDVPGRGKPHTASGYFFDRRQAAEEIVRFDAESTPGGIYVTINPPNPDLHARSPDAIREFIEPVTADHDILCRRHMIIDCDASRPAKVMATDEQKHAAFELCHDVDEYLRSSGWPLPLTGMSGSGFYLIHRIDLPNDEESRFLIERILKALAHQFLGRGATVDTSMFNAARIIRVFGTANRKGFSTSRQPHRRAELFEPPEDWQVVSRELLENVARLAPEDGRETDRWPHAANRRVHNREPFDLDGFIRRHGIEVATTDSWKGDGRIHVLKTCPYNESHTDKSAFIGQQPDGAIVAGCHHNGCKSLGWGWRELRERFEPGCNDRCQRDSHAQQSEEEPARKRFTIYTSAELDEMEFSENAIIENAMIESQPGGMFGGSKMLKSMISMDAGVSVATATCFLGCPFFRVPRSRRVLIMSGESGVKALQQSARRIAQARGIERLGDIENLLWSDEVPFLGAPYDALEVGEIIKEHGVNLLILDPTYQMLDARDSGNLFAQGIQLRRILDVCRRQDCDFYIIHHTTRAASKTYDPPTLNDASWAGFTEFVGQWMLIGRRERYKPGSGVHRLWLELGARGEHQMGWAIDVDENADERGRPQGWSVMVKPAAETGSRAKHDEKSRRQAEQLEADKQAIIAALVRMPSGGTKTDIRDASGIRTVRFNPGLATLIRVGAVVQCSLKKPNNQTYDGYRLKEEK